MFLDYLTKNSRQLFGFELNNLKSWNKLVMLMNRAEDPSNLAVFRILYGI